MARPRMNEYIEMRECIDLYNTLKNCVAPDERTTETDIINHLNTLHTQEEKVIALKKMLVLLNNEIRLLSHKYDALRPHPRCNPETIKQYEDLITWLSHYANNLHAKLNPNNCIEYMTNKLHNFIAENDLDKMTALTFTLVFQAEHFLPRTGAYEMRTEDHENLVTMNRNLGKKLARETSHFSKFRVASGIALMVLGVAATITLGIVLAPYAGITLAVGATVLGIAAKLTSTMVILATLYAVTECVTGIARRANNGGEMRGVPLFAGMATGAGTAATSAAVTTISATTAFTLGGLTATFVYGVAAALRGGHLLWTSGAKSNRHRQYAEQALELRSTPTQSIRNDSIN
ncbi:MAG TPA: hypothetical protein VLJ15_06645 [Gammaproteobacteria bacterium]|nr:hypothetical protein [Gammaproteobacteria bacterium]